MKDTASDDRLTYYEKIPANIFSNAEEASLFVAREIMELIRQRNNNGKKTVLGLATGSTPTRVYEELVRMHREENLSFKHVITFNLDEYYPMQPDSLQSYVHFMHEHLFDHIDIPEDQVHIPDGTVDEGEISEYCEQYEQMIRDAGGIDIQLLGIGRTGHIGFNEPGSRPNSRTRLISLDKVTRKDAASDFFGEENVPRRAITMGVGTILEADKIFMMAWGEGKAAVIKEAVEGQIRENVPASYLQNHPDSLVVLDEAASADLTRVKTPWLLTSCDWNDDLMRKAVVWLCFEIEKPVLKLTDEDYNEYGMGDLLTDCGPAYSINLKIFNELQHTITGWPGGKPNADDTYRPERAEPYPKRVLVFSPHPDDDVISMGGTLIRLVEHDHDVHVAYQTSGNIAVFDDEVIRYSDFVTAYLKEFDEVPETIAELYSEIGAFLKQKHPGDIDSDKIQLIKTLIRRNEATTAGRYCGIQQDHLHFLEMPFYETGRVRKKSLTEADVEIIINLLREIKPHQIYAAGDLSDPHGTHRVCLKAIVKALQTCQNDSWIEHCFVWLYRGAWQEWDINEIEMAVPLSPQELLKKRRAIFKHQSQKDRPLFPGPDEREFWQRAEDRNRNTARLYDLLGFAEYEAMEAFVRYRVT